MPEKMEKHIHKETEIFDVLTNAVCCMMCVDGKITESERTAIHKVLEQNGAPWGYNVVEKHIDDFLQRLKKCGLTQSIEDTRKKISLFREQGKEGLLMQALNYVMYSDGKIKKKEIELCERFKAELAEKGSVSTKNKNPYRYSFKYFMFFISEGGYRYGEESLEQFKNRIRAWPIWKKALRLLWAICYFPLYVVISWLGFLIIMFIASLPALVCAGLLLLSVLIYTYSHTLGSIAIVIAFILVLIIRKLFR